MKLVRKVALAAFFLIVLWGNLSYFKANYTVQTDETQQTTDNSR